MPIQEAVMLSGFIFLFALSFESVTERGVSFVQNYLIASASSVTTMLLWGSVELMRLISAAW